MFHFRSYIIAEVVVCPCSVKCNCNVFGCGKCPVFLQTCITYMEIFDHDGSPAMSSVAVVCSCDVVRPLLAEHKLPPPHTHKCTPYELIHDTTAAIGLYITDYSSKEARIQ